MRTRDCGTWSSKWEGLTLALLLLLLLTITAHAKPSLSYSDSGLWTFPRDAAQQRDLVASVAFPGVQVWDGATLLDDYQFGNQLGHRIAWADDVIAATTATGGLFLIDTSDSTALSLLYSGTGYGTYPDVAVRNDTLFVAGGNGLALYNIGSGTPSPLWSLGLSSEPNAVAAGDSFCLVSGAGRTYSVGFASESALDSLEVGAEYLDWQSDTGAASNENSGLALIDTTDPSNLVAGGSYDPGDTRGVWVYTTGDSVGVLREDDTPVLLDTSTIGSPTLLDSSATVHHQPRGASLLGSVVAGTNWSHLTSGAFRFSATTLDSLSLGQGWDYIRNAGGNAAACGDMGAAWFSISAGALTLEGTYEHEATWGTFTTGDTLYLCSADDTAAPLERGLIVVDFTTPSSPTLIDSLLHGYARDVEVANGVAYVAGFTDGLWLVDVSDPANLALLDDATRAGQQAFNVALSGETAFTADGPDGLNSWDVSDPSAIAHYDNFATTGGCADVASYRDRVYIVETGLGVIGLDASDPSAMVAMDTLLYTNATRAEMDDTFLHILDDGFGVYTYRHSTSPWNPVLLDSIATNDDAKGAAILRDGSAYYLAVADDSNLRLLELDLSTGTWCQ